MNKQVVNFDDPNEKRKYLSYAGALRGRRRMQDQLYRKRRSVDQNESYWSMVVEPFGDWLKRMDEDNLDCQERAHRILTDTFLRVPETNKYGEVLFDPSGNPLMRTRSTTELTTAEFSDFFDKCRNLLAELPCNIIVPDPDPDWKLKQLPARRGNRGEPALT